MDAQSLIPLNPRDYLILFSLAEEDRHGYGIVKDVERQSGGAVRIDPANLYRTLKRMVGTGLVEEVEGEGSGDGRQRRFYRVTSLGRAVVELEAARLADLTEAARHRRLIPETGPSM